MTILWIYNQPMAPEAGGTERVTALLCAGLEQRGHRCMGVLSFDETGNGMHHPSGHVENLYAFLQQNGVDIVINQIAHSRWLLEAFLERGGKQWQQEGGRIISCLHFDPCNPPLHHLFSSKWHKTWSDRFQMAKTWLLKAWYTRRQQEQESAIYNYIYEHSDRMVALTPAHFPYLRRVMRRPDYERLVSIGNPLTFEDISLPESLGEKKKLVLVCARMSEYHKRLSLVLKTWAYLQRHAPIASEWTLKLVGDGSELEDYREYARQHHIPRLYFEGQQSPEPYYREASILLLTSGAEGWPMVLMEGLQRGVVPVVMDSCPVFRDIIRHGVNGILSPNGDIARYAAAISGLMNDDGKRQAMQLAALDSARAFTLDKTLDTWASACGIN